MPQNPWSKMSRSAISGFVQPTDIDSTAFAQSRGTQASTGNSVQPLHERNNCCGRNPPNQCQAANKENGGCVVDQ